MHRPRQAWMLPLASLALVASVLFNFYLLLSMQSLSHRVDRARDVVQEARTTIDSAATAASQHLTTTTLATLAGSVDSLIDSALAPLRDSVSALRKEGMFEAARLNASRESRRRAELGLPNLVSLDSLGLHYSQLARDKKRFGFETRRGHLSFDWYAVRLGILKDPSRTAWVRIGKQESTETGELIRAWLSEAEQSKLAQGYVRVSSARKPTDYGEQTETLLERGDDYCRTSFLYERVQGTYNSTSFRYTYFVEVGSKRRKQAYEKEQYTKGLGG